MWRRSKYNKRKLKVWRCWVRLVWLFVVSEKASYQNYHSPYL